MCKEQVAKLEKEIERLKNSSAALYALAVEFEENKKYSTSKNKLEELLKAYPTSGEAKLAKAKISELNKVIEQEELANRAEEKRRRDGWKKLKVSRNGKIDAIGFKIISTKKNRKWVCDRYPGEIQYYESHKKSLYSIVDIMFSSDDGNPLLPAAYLLRVDGEVLRNVGAYDLKFFGWESYATYLGNYHDSRNDFSKRNTVKFTMGRQIDKDKLKKEKHYIGLWKKRCLVRKYKRFSRPPVSYDESNCSSPYKVTLDDLNNWIIIGKI